MLCASVDARHGGRGYAVRNGSLPQPQPEHLSRPEARVRLVHESGLCLPLSATHRVGPAAGWVWGPTHRCLGAHPSARAAEEAAVPPSPGGRERAEAAKRRRA